MSTLSQYFFGVAMKRLVSGELPYDPSKGRTSTQHEFNSTSEMTQLFGNEKIEKKRTTYLYISDREDDTLMEDGSFSFYDSRKNKPHRSAEYRIYYNSKNPVLTKANENDLLFVGKTLDDHEIFIIAEQASTAEQQLKWLFGFKTENTEFQIKDLSTEKSNLEFVQKYILNAIGIEVEESQDDFLTEMIEKFKGDFPKTITFSKFARSKVKNVNPVEDPDYAIVKWYEMEYELFRTLEKYLIGNKLKSGFGKEGQEVEEFLKYSLSIHQRRKSRSGDAFENHLKEIFDNHQLRFTPQAKIGRAKPDFIFPGKEYYDDQTFSTELLTMLGAKTTAKERWKQLIPETKIAAKHFITLEPAISKNQTDDMIDKQIQLIIPESIIASYKPEQQKTIKSLRDFIDLVTDRQKRSGISHI